MTTPFIRLSGSRPYGIMGLIMDKDIPFRNKGGQYLFLEIPMRPILTDKGNPRKIIKAGELVFLQAACTLEPKKAHVDIILNNELETTGYCGYQHRIERGDTVEITVAYVPFKDIDINTLMADEWFVRLYAMD